MLKQLTWQSRQWWLKFALIKSTLSCKLGWQGGAKDVSNNPQQSLKLMEKKQ